MKPPPRLAPERPFPSYAFLPGRDPHPTRDPRGHSYRGDAAEEDVVYSAPQSWADNEDYLYGVDLYNYGYLWEAHEAWEGLWHVSKHDPAQADFLQGLIQCAAASLKIPMEQPKGTQRLGALGTEKILRVMQQVGPHYMGLDLGSFAGEFRAFLAANPSSADERPFLELDEQG